MAAESHIVLVRVAVVVVLLAWNLEFLASLRPETKNRMHVDRWTCTLKNPQIMKYLRCKLKYISRTHVNVLYHAEYKSLDSIWFHTEIYYKFNGIVDNKFPIDVWENFCDYVDGRRGKTWFQNWIFNKILPYSNFNHTCPYSKAVIKANNISMDKTFAFTESIVPSGRYHVIVTITTEERVPLLVMDFYGTVAEHYYEKI